ncbi:Asp-tRNA(Asn)/Glu-tRNA(Gln) amidotransferase subunit GatA [Candidatus Pacearchaeota archaeon]|nr:Asp-tRNA(Asn)/Glu-tRNA(Gln) amidotransferase subunit GatA [Candidatus Pacearchaeota archaeon]
MGALVTKVQKYLDVIKKRNKDLNIFLHVNENILDEAKALEGKKTKGALWGTVVAVKSNINVQGMITNCASKVLENYVAPYDATVIQKLKQADALLIGMVTMDEFAAGGSGENSAFGPTKNPLLPELVPGGSSSGSAAAVAAGMCDVALGSDTGGSIRTPASHCGIVGMKPSYGAVSRYGLIDLSMSLDQIGPLGNTVQEVQKVFEVIQGVDAADPTTIAYPALSKKGGSLKVGVVTIAGVAPVIQKLIDARVAALVTRHGWTVKKISIDSLDLAVATYYPLVYSEFYSATRRFDGARYGKPFVEYAGKEALRRMYGGQEITQAEFAGKYYQKALGVKQVIAASFNDAFKNVDCIVLPTCPGLPWKLGEGTKMPLEAVYAYDACTIPANLAGCCAISLPAGESKGVPVGLQLMCAQGEDMKLLEIAQKCAL